MARKITIPVKALNTKVSGLLNTAKAPSHLLVLGHGAGAGMQHPFMDALAKALAARGISCLRYQFPYMEQGRKAPGSAKQAIQTVAAATAKAKLLAKGIPLLVGGKSYGGRMSSHAAAEGLLEGINGLVFFGFPLHAPGREGIERAAHLKSVKLPMLFLQGSRDKLARADLIKQVSKRKRKAKLILYEGADHSFKLLKSSGITADQMIERLAEDTAQWAKR